MGSVMTGRMPMSDVPLGYEGDGPVVAFLGKLFAYAAVFLVGSLAVLLGAGVIGLAVRIFLIVSGVAP